MVCANYCYLEVVLIASNTIYFNKFINLGAKRLTIITGQGIHSTNGPKIKPAVIDLLMKEECKGSVSW